MDEVRTLRWAHGSLTVQRLGAMLAPVRFDLPSGRMVEPLHIAPWADDGTISDVELAALPPILHRLRGEWPCVPFGADEPENLAPQWSESMGRRLPLPANPPPHGESSNCKWNWEAAGSDRLCLSLDYPDDHPIARVERDVIPDPDAAAVNLVLRIIPRANCQLPLGLHPTFALPPLAGSASIMPPHAKQIRSYPGSLEPGGDIFAPNAVFTNLTEAPDHKGQAMDASSIPFEQPGEDLLQLVGVDDGRVSLDNHAGGYRATLSWNAEHFPSLLIWYSNRGRQQSPWLGRHTALGLEPVCSAFDLGAAIATGDNPIAQQGVPTSIPLRAGEVFQTHYRIAADDLASGS
ncbi:MAG: hypothetical protein ACSHYC_13365 [Alphaproteobacteria bacterium]